MNAALWGAFIVIGAVTYFTRALPLLLARRGDGAEAPPPAWLDALGPCLLTAIAAAMLLPEARSALLDGSLRAFALGAAAAAVVMMWRGNLGLTTLAGITAYWLAL